MYIHVIFINEKKNKKQKKNQNEIKFIHKFIYVSFITPFFYDFSEKPLDINRQLSKQFLIF